MMVEYPHIPNDIIDVVLPRHFKVDVSPDEREQMMNATKKYSKVCANIRTVMLCCSILLCTTVAYSFLYFINTPFFYFLYFTYRGLFITLTKKCGCRSVRVRLDRRGGGRGGKIKNSPGFVSFICLIVVI